ncbi:SAM-dependent methyltransferase [Gemmobacter aquaticus]|uniref:SAM-dependent methyltransferase n=1 Tax=Gemmobacter aquaticus TaxID=490185 RepID=A0A917YG97_9RHOB|nr:RsmB/NOP family class I SAM-dependent RNA methyltransferase [Gemmobacter aquaticus]GGO24799.1 SAM-dependent methyltransferase [Gemmobacter aquaticus]
MTPAARLSAAIEILDRVLAGAPAEQVLTNWARASRFAGSGDRHAVRDLVYDALRCRRSFAALGGAETGRGLILGGLRSAGVEPETLFTGEGHAPAPLSSADIGQAPTGFAALDIPDWLASQMQQDMGDAFEAVAEALRHRAPVFLRANLARGSRDSAREALAEAGIEAEPHPLSPTALLVTAGARRVSASEPYTGGLVELQDAASQAVVDALPLADGMRVLDYCAGGGGKSLAMAARARVKLFAHDSDPRRMRDLPARAKRAGVKVEVLPGAPSGLFDLVLADAPCSGSGSWRRAPEGKWALTPERLQDLRNIQSEILDKASALVQPRGWFAYATCSLLNAENRDQIDAFLARTDKWSLQRELRLTPIDGADGFYLALLQRIT